MLRLKRKWLRGSTLILMGGLILTALGVLGAAYVSWASLYGVMSALLVLLTLLLSRLVSQLEQARNAAVAAADAKTRFITSVSHELRTPMNAIIAGAHQVQQIDLLPDAQRTLQIVSSSAQQLTVLINDILDFSYFDAREFRVLNRE